MRLVLPDNERDRVDPYRVSSVPKISSRVFICPPDPYILCVLACFWVAFERVHDIRWGEGEALEYLRQKAAIQQYLWSPPQMCVHSFIFSAHLLSHARLSKKYPRSRRPARPCVPGRPVDIGGASHFLNEGFTNLPGTYRIGFKSPGENEECVSINTRRIRSGTVQGVDARHERSDKYQEG